MHLSLNSAYAWCVHCIDMAKLYVEAMFFTLLDLPTTIRQLAKKQKAHKRMNAILLGWQPKRTAHV